MKLNINVAILFLFVSTFSYAQLKVNAELRPRFEYRHGYKTLFPENIDPAAFVSQRTRLNTSFKIEKLDFYLSIQDIRVWGDVAQLNNTDNNGFSLHESWAKIGLSDHTFLKVGRQEIIYDDSRFFGNVNWAQQGRSHDVAILKFKKDNFKLDIGVAFNQDEEALTETTLNTNTYKSFQYLWLHKDWEYFSGSFLFLNNGLQFIDDTNTDNNETRYSQTLGYHLKYNKEKFDLTGNLYYQFGNDILDNKLNAFLLGLEADYQMSNKTKLNLGIELQRGNDNGTITNGNNNAFTPLYGTNHKFNGFMDYFFVGNHANNIGLLDIHAKVNFKLHEKSNLHFALHNFSAAAEFTNKLLGNELDIVYSHKLQKYVSLKAGYSHLFVSEGIEFLKGNTDGNTNNWGWVMLTVKPTLFHK